MKFIQPAQTLAEARWNQFPVYEVFGLSATAVAAIGVGVAATGVGVSLYGQSQASASAKGAASSNAYISKMAAQAQAQSAIYSNELNYKTAMAQSQEQANNATILHNYAGNIETQGNEEIARLAANQAAQNSHITAEYGASGVQGDSGSPLQVAAYKGGIDQLKRMDAAYQVNMKAIDTDYQGTMQTYQSQLTKETAQQYKYAEQMAEWNAAAGIVGANTQQANTNAAANAQMIGAYGQGIAGVGNAITSGLSIYGSMGGTFSGSGMTPTQTSSAWGLSPGEGIA